MTWMREKRDDNSRNAAQPFSAKLLMLSGNTILTFHEDDKDSKELIQKTLEARALACCYNGYCDDEELLSTLRNMMAKQPKIKDLLHDYLKQRLGNVTIDEPRHLFNSKLGHLLDLQQSPGLRMI